jgi:hypothetical protein
MPSLDYRLPYARAPTTMDSSTSTSVISALCRWTCRIGRIENSVTHVFARVLPIYPVCTGENLIKGAVNPDEICVFRRR